MAGFGDLFSNLFGGILNPQTLPNISGINPGSLPAITPPAPPSLPQIPNLQAPMKPGLFGANFGGLMPQGSPGMPGAAPQPNLIPNTNPAAANVVDPNDPMSNEMMRKMMMMRFLNKQQGQGSQQGSQQGQMPSAPIAPQMPTRFGGGMTGGQMGQQSGMTSSFPMATPLRKRFIGSTEMGGPY